MLKKTIASLGLGVCILGANAFAQPAEEVALSETRYSASAIRKSFVPAVDLSYGYMDQNGNVDASGEGVSIMMIGTHYFQDSFWLADAGVGFHHQNLDEGEGDQALGIISASARYRFPWELSLGPVLQGYIGNAEAFGRDDNFTGMIGGIGFKEFFSQNGQIFRVGLKYTTDIASSNQSTDVWGLVLELTGRRARSMDGSTFTSL